MESSNVVLNKHNGFFYNYPLTALSLAYFFTYATIYTLHDFNGKIFDDFLGKENFGVTFIVTCLNIFKVLGTLVFSFTAEKTNKHKQLLSLSFMMYGFAILNLFWPNYFLRGYFPISYVCAIFFGAIFYYTSQGGIFGLLDAYSTNVLKEVGLIDNFSRVRSFSAFGHAFAYIPGYVSLLFDSGNILNRDHNLKFIYGMLIAVTSSLYFYFCLTHFKPYVEEKMAKDKPTYRIIRSYLNLVFSTRLGLVYIAILTQGYQRSTFSSLKRILFQDYLNYTEAEGNTLQLIRLLFEFLLFQLIDTKKINRSMPYVMFLVALMFGCFRPVAYCYVNKNTSRGLLFFILQMCEFTKALYSSAYGFSSVFIARDLATPETLTMVQASVSMIYTGLSNVIAALYNIYLFWNMKKSEVTFSLIIHIFRISAVLAIFGIVSFLFVFMKTKNI